MALVGIGPLDASLCRLLRTLQACSRVASEEEARHVAAKVESCRAAEDDVRAMLAMVMGTTVSEEVRQQAAAQYDTEGDQAEEVLAVLMRHGGILCKSYSV